MKSKKAWLMPVSLLLVCGMIACGEKPQPVVGKPKPAAEEPKAEVSEPDLTELPKAAKEAVAAQKGLPVEITNSIGMKLVLIAAGEFMMGSPDSDRDADNDEKPQHKVRITKPFYLGVHEVTQQQYEKVIGENPSEFKGAGNPVETVSWDDAVEFCKKLSAKEGKTYRLPTEAEWEYACRAGTTTAYSFGDDEESLGEYAWYNDNSDVKTHPAGEKKPNPWGLYDMHGNVWEWCQDWYGEYPAEHVTNPRGPSQATTRVYRGGGWSFPVWYCRSSFRYRIEPTYRDDLGFRVAADPSGK
ncbi:MAG: formylglycine-generating enzyme family protein [Pirellulaceae bacterium]|nr:formylglycine-generating enzyme family protein [Pirellulaceae bacterium]